MVISRSTIAVVDDDDDIRKSLRRLLPSAGFVAIAFASAEDYLASMSEIKAACLILDVRLPGQSGVASYQQLRQRSSKHFVWEYDNEKRY